jgi:hypothetical protein
MDRDSGVAHKAVERLCPESPPIARLSGQVSDFMGKWLLALALFFVLVIGVRYRHKSLSINTPTTAEGSAPFNFSVVFVRNPSEDTDSPSVVVQKYAIRFIAHDLLTGEGPRRRLAWLKYNRGREFTALFSFVWPLHRKLTLVPFDPTSYLDNPCRSPADIGNVKLTGNRHSAFKEWSGRNGVLRSFYYDVAHDQSWPLRQDQGIFADLGLARGSFGSFPRLSERFFKVERLLGGLTSHLANRAPSGPSSPEGDKKQGPTRPFGWPEPIVPIARLIIGCGLLGIGSRVEFLCGLNPIRCGRTWDYVGTICLGLGLALLLIRGGW